MKVETLIMHLQRIDPTLEVINGTMRKTWKRYHPRMLEVHKKGQRDDLRAQIAKEMNNPDLEGFVIL